MVQFDDKGVGDRVSDLHTQEEERLVQALAPQYGYEYVNLKGYTINPDALSRIPEKEARAAGVAGFAATTESFSIAAKSPNHPATQALLESLKSDKYTISVFMCSQSSLDHAWKRYADLTDTKAERRGVFEISAENLHSLTSAIKTREDVAAKLLNISTINNTHRITETLEIIFAGALALETSDIHIEPEEAVIRLRYRLDGVLHDIADLDNYIYKRLMSRLKLLSGMVLNSRVEAQDGRFTFETSEKEIEVRSSVIPGAIGESIVMRLLDPTVASFSIDKLDLNEHIKAAMEHELKKPNGLIITTGPTGSGKTTALYAFMQEVHKEGIKIITIENPVEYKLEGIVQTQTGDDYTFASGLRAILRQDPDVIMVGEIRDREVAETAMHAAQTGHLVFSTLHTNSAVGGFPRLLDLGVDPRIMGSSINIMLGQRLLRLLCPNCKEAYQASVEETEVVTRVNAQHPKPQTLTSPLTLYRSPGCKECGGTGFKGRSGIFEAIVMDDAVEEVVIRDPREHVILEAARPQGIPTMAEDGMEKVIQGLTSLQELERVVELPTAPTVVPLATDNREDKEMENDFLSHIVT